MISVDNLRPLGQKILFQFLDDSNAKGFTNKTSWNFTVKTHENNVKDPRWGRVMATGNDVPASIQKGDYILIEPLMWTVNFETDGQKYWATDFDRLIGSLKEEPTGIF